MSFSVFRICLARGRIFRRFLAEHAFVLFVLGPMILGAVAWVAERYLDLLRDPLLHHLAPEAPFPDRPSVVLGLIFAALLWPSALREVFGPRGHSQDLLDTLPLREMDRFGVIWLTQAARSLVLALLIGMGLWALAPPEVGLRGLATLQSIGGLVAALLLIGVLDVLWVALAVPFGWASSSRLLIVSALLTAWLAVPASWTLWALLPWAVAGRALKVPLVTALSSPGGPPATADGPELWLLIVTLLLVSVAAAMWIVRYRRRDLEKAQALDLPEGRGPTFGWVARLQGRRLPPSTGAQLRRDLLMIYRRFSPAVPAALILTLLSNLVMVALSFDSQLPDPWIRRGMVAAGFIGQLCTVSVVPFLLKAQLPIFWLEKSTGVALEHVWQTKWVLAVWVIVPQGIVATLLLVFLGPGSILELTAATVVLWVVSLVAATLTGVSVFEIAEQPILGLTLSSFFASAAAALFIFYTQASWLWLIFVGYFVSHLTARASRRVQLTEVER